MSTADKPEQNESQELKGHVEETAGRIFGDDDLVARGRADQIAAHAKQAAAQAGEAAKSVGQRVKERALHKLGELHERLHEAAEEKQDPDTGPDPDSGTPKDSLPDTHDLRQSGHEDAR